MPQRGSTVGPTAAAQRRQQPGSSARFCLMRASVLLVSAVLAAGQNSTCGGSTNIYDGSFKSNFINGTAFNYNAYQGQVLMITNVASF